ncbi:MAG: DNA repair protein RecO [Eubacterium sp.]|nr:DNA repair protein RecO [Eubacterium sp.]
MSIEKMRGVVIREVPVGESDKIITLLSKEGGKVSLSARGARNAKSKFLSSCELFAYSDFTVYTGRKHPSVSTASLIDNFYGLRKEIKAFAAGSYLADFLNRVVFEGVECDEILRLFLTALKVLEKGSEPLFTTTVFELKYFYLNGMMPDFNEIIHFGGDELLKGTAKALLYIGSADVKKVFSFNVSEEVSEQIKRIRYLLFNEQIDIRFNSYDFLLSLY